ncbi:MAG: hypothetical protein HY717_01770 [Planctomycetes bacterium]|nr:hypothetical protein [Planctomycetota bacterium]
MKNLTITLQEDVAQWIRVWAAQHNTSVSRFVGELLKQKMLEEQGYQAAMQRDLSRPHVNLSNSGKYPKREELYDRKVLRGH